MDSVAKLMMTWLRHGIKYARAHPSVLVILSSLLWFSLFAWRGLTIDEYTTWQNTRLDLTELLLNRLRAGHMPTFFVLIHFFVRWVGDSEFALRFFSILSAAVGMGFFWFLAEMVAGRSAATLATAALATNQVTLWCAQNARPYAGILLCGIVIGWAITQYVVTSRTRYLVAIVLTVIFGVSLHAAFALTIAAFLVCVHVGFRIARKQRILLFLSLALPLAFMFVPVAILAQHQEKFQIGVAYPTEPDLRRPINLLARIVFGDYKLWGRGVMKFFTLALFAVFLFASRAQYHQSRPRYAELTSIWRVTIAWVCVPIIGLFLTEIITRENVLSHPRYLVHILPPVALIIGTGAKKLLDTRPSQRTHQVLRIVPILLAFAFNLVSSYAWLRTNGDGPHLLAPLLLDGKFVSVVGTTSPLEYEWRGRNHPPLVSLPGVPLSRVSAGAQREIIEKSKCAILEELEKGAVWVFIYNNRTTTLDVVVEELHQSHLQTKKNLSICDARAFLISKNLSETREAPSESYSSY